MAATARVTEASGGGTGTGQQQPQQPPVDYMTVAAAKAVEEAKATKRLMQATLPSKMLAPWLKASEPAVLPLGEVGLWLGVCVFGQVGEP